jgi:osmotically-inducible protein OsmY
MRRWMVAGAALALILLLLPGCSGGKTGGGGRENTGNAGNVSEDSQITRAVQEKLDADPTLKAAGIKARATGGQVELTGTVKTIPDKDKAEAATREAIQGFKSVNAGIVNNIEIAEDNTSNSGATSGTSGK